MHYRFSSCTGSKQWWIVPLRAPDPQVCSAFLLFLLCLTAVWTPFSQLLLVRIKSMTMTWSATTTSTWLHASWRFGWVRLKIQGAWGWNKSIENMCYSSFYSKSMETIEIMHCCKHEGLCTYYTELITYCFVIIIICFFLCIHLILSFLLVVFFLCCWFSLSFFVFYVSLRPLSWFRLFFIYVKHMMFDSSFRWLAVSSSSFYLLVIIHIICIVFLSFLPGQQYLDIPRQLYRNRWRQVGRLETRCCYWSKTNGFG